MFPFLSLFLAVAAPAAAAPSDSCPWWLQRTIDERRIEAHHCFAPGASWEDEFAAREGRHAVRDGLLSLIGRRPRTGRSGQVSWRASSTTFFSGFSSRGSGGRLHHILAVDRSSAGWKNARLYSTPRPWPAPAAGPPAPPEDREAVLKAFNERFSGGDADGWADIWHEDALFVSYEGPFRGSGIRDFFRKQSSFLDGPKLAIHRDHTAAGTDTVLVEGEISGSCRKSGRPFRIKALFALRIREGRILRLQEAFSRQNIRCE